MAKSTKVMNMEEEAEEDEDPQTKALRIFRSKLLYMACGMDSSSPNIPDNTTVKNCRLVCRDWDVEVSKVFRSTGKSLLIIDLQKLVEQGVVSKEAETIFDMLRCSLVRLLEDQDNHHQFCQFPFPPVKLILPTYIFYKKVEDAFIQLFTKVDYNICELHCFLPRDSTMEFNWPSLNLKNLQKITFKCTTRTYDGWMDGWCSIIPNNPYHHGDHMNFIQQVLEGAVNAKVVILQCRFPNSIRNLFKIKFPLGVNYLDVPVVKMPFEELSSNSLKPISVFKNLKHLIIRSPLTNVHDAERAQPGDLEITANYANFLLKMNGENLEKLELRITELENDDDLWVLGAELNVQFTKPLKCLKCLTIHGGDWKIFEMKSYLETMPRLQTLELIKIKNSDQIRHLYQSTSSETIERLYISFVKAIPHGVLIGLANNLPMLKELEIVLCDLDILNLNFQTICLKFFQLKKLDLTCHVDSQTMENLLNMAVTGIRFQPLQEMQDGNLPMTEAIRKCCEDHPITFRDLTELEELKFRVNGNRRIDMTLMLRASFLRMPSLTRLILSENLTIREDQEDFITRENQNGLVVTWI